MAKSKRQRPRAERRSKPGPERGPAVSAEDRTKLATCCAFFKAVQYREAGPDSLRESDVEIAQEAISEAIETSCGPREQRARRRK
ncbi:MAG TPA: hypothetical protein VHP37_29330 [Burkholderiales bacterium]|nr:hypothetical protein [Burkholderiales bacterium]